MNTDSDTSSSIPLGHCYSYRLRKTDNGIAMDLYWQDECPGDYPPVASFTAESLGHIRYLCRLISAR